jgi:hypothetical protein
MSATHGGASPKTEDQEKQLHSLSWEGLLKGLGLVLTLTYATGFLVVFTFLAGFGITDFVGELFKLKYFYVGILCVSFPAFVALPLTLKWRAISRRHSLKPQILITLPISSKRIGKSMSLNSLHYSLFLIWWR